MPFSRIFAVFALIFFLLPPLSAVSQQDILLLKTYADAFNASRNFQSRFGPIEQNCLSSGTFLTTLPCNDLASCTNTANLVCSVSGGACDLQILAAAILDYKQGIDALNAANSEFYSAYNSFSSSSPLSSLGAMDSAFDDMKTAADRVGQNKLRFPDKIPCPCGNSSNCCIGRCAEPNFNYTAISQAKSLISDIKLMKCSDGTIGGECSSSKPKECVLGELFDNSQRCGCPVNMRPASNGKACEFIPCIDNGISVPSGTCSPYKEKKCVNGILVSKAGECGCPAGKAAIGNSCAIVCSDGTFDGQCSSAKPLFCQNGALVNNSAICGCPAGHIPSNNSCACPIISSEFCNTTIETKYHNVTYYFDRGMKEIRVEQYTFSKKRCYPMVTQYGGEACSEIANKTINSTPISETPDPYVVNVKNIACDRCPAVCTRNPPANLLCGSCACPSNLGFCDENGARENISSTPAYCTNELLLPQKNNSATCQNNFECQSSLCYKTVCTDPNSIGYRVQLFFGWFAQLFGGKAG